MRYEKLKPELEATCERFRLNCIKSTPIGIEK